MELEDLKEALSLAGTAFADPDLGNALLSASSEIDAACGENRRFVNTGATVSRYYTPEDWCLLEILDATTITEVAVDTGGDGSFSQTWATTDYVTEPLNAAADSWAIERLRVSAGGSYRFPTGQVNSVKVTGVWGWPSVPRSVADATGILAHRISRRIRGDAPFGVITVPGTESGMARLARTDPDVARMIGRFTRNRPFL
jgi:hypothetical protein